MDTKEYLQKQYANAENFNARVYLSARFSTNPYGWTKWMFDRISFPPHASVLELGCGPAFLWESNLDRLPQDAEILLTDFSEGMLLEAKSRLGENAARFTFNTVNAEEIPYPDACFDIVVANHMLYHLPDRKKALAEIARVLKPEGVLYASTIGRGNMKELHELTQKCFSIEPRARRTVADAFGLENGEEQLKEFFKYVELHTYENSLLVTEAWPLVAYLLSAGGRVTEIFTQERIQKLEAYLAGILEQQGSIRITKESGLFIAQND